jgi:hypothetical protein
LTFLEFIPILREPSKDDFPMAYPPSPPLSPLSSPPDFGNSGPRKRIGGLLGPYLEAKAGIAPRGLLELDPNWPPDAELWAQTAASVNSSLFPDFSALSAALGLHGDNGAGPFSGTLSANAPPQPAPALAAPGLGAKPRQYLEGGLGAGSDWRDQFTASGFDRTPSWLGDAASALDPQRGAPLFNASPAPAQNLPEFRGPDFLFPEMLQLAPTSIPAQDIVDAGSLGDAGHKEKFAYSVIGHAEGDTPDASTDPLNPSVAGISGGLVRELAPKIPGFDSRARPDQLTPQQRAQIYRAYFDRELSDAFGHDTLEEIGHSGVAAFVADTIFREGARGKRMIQDAINSVLDAQRQRGTNVENTDTSGRFNLETLYTLNKIIENGDDRQKLLREIKLRRDTRHTAPNTWKGEALRTQHVFELGVAKDQ